jgi:hypothetical protein
MFIFKKNRSLALACLLITGLTGLYTKFYTGSAAQWVNNSLGGVFYEIFWCLFIYFFFTTMKPSMIAFFVLIVTCFLEFLQLLHFSFLELIRNTLTGQILIGTSFTWSDFPYYFFGCLAGWFLIKKINRSSGSEKTCCK